ncbi:BQ2448_7374 [Microbotryum intermedium]|uniref:BQ2448_7374 protein n=1 Tax=Microbotryum intermedium TaxID=269621 RepID=A0A238FQG6_9BASI|nr:BQ2448_7374 [Microbotryum intermedium]
MIRREFGLLSRLEGACARASTYSSSTSDYLFISPSLHPVFGDFVCPLVSRSERRLVELRILFFHSTWKLARRGRFSSQPLEPIT